MKTVVVEGVTDVSSAGGAVRDGEKWRGVVLLVPWRGPDGMVQNEKLRVLLPPEADGEKAMRASKSLRQGAVLKLTVQMLPREPRKGQSANLVGDPVRTQPSPELGASNAAMSETVTIRDSRLGRLERGPKSPHFTGSLRVRGRSCPLLVWVPRGAPAEPTVAKASRIVERVLPRLPAVPAEVAKKLLALANEWRGDMNRSPLSVAQLAKRLRLTEISVPESGDGLDLDYGCGDALGEHGIKVSLTSGGKVRRAQMA